MKFSKIETKTTNTPRLTETGRKMTSGFIKNVPSAHKKEKNQISITKEQDTLSKNDKIEPFNLVELTKDLPNSSFKKGMQGHVVDLYDGPPPVAEVEIISVDDVRQVPISYLKFISEI